MNLQKDHLYSYLKGVTYTSSRNRKINYKHMYVFGLIRFKNILGLQTFYKCILDCFFPNKNTPLSGIAVISGIQREYEHICKAGKKVVKGDREDLTEL